MHNMFVLSSADWTDAILRANQSPVPLKKKKKSYNIFFLFFTQGTQWSQNAREPV